ncbi:MAG: aminotransferase class IV family protein, partial [Deltaproteobacteria bacterium]|nr:aminotransferase class IV family protein [Deltaproteobacteria bacterium]
IKTINANKVKEAYVRVNVSLIGLSVGFARPPKTKTNFTIFAKPFIGRPDAVYRNGAKVALIESVFADDPEVAEIKSTNYLTKMIARREALDKKSDEGLFQSRDGFILEGTATNLFAVKKGRLFTPPLSDGCLPGITRWVIMGLAENLDIPCKEASLDKEDLKGVDEIFLTGSTSEILPVREVTGLAKKSPSPGPVTAKLMKAYKQLVTARI